MRSINTLAAAAACLLLSGCGDLVSLHALYTERDSLFDAAIEGRWEDKDDFLTVERAGAMYEVSLQSKKDPTEVEKYEVRLVDINGVRFADVLPLDYFGHMFLKVRVAGGQLRFAFFDSEWLRRQVPHEEADQSNGRKQAVLTARTPELRNIVAKYASEPKAYDDEMVFRRRP